MGKNSKKTLRSLSTISGKKYILTNFNEKGSDFLDNPFNGCLYLGKDWSDNSHRTFVIVIPQEKISVLYDLIRYKFGNCNLYKESKFFYFVWDGVSCGEKKVKNIMEDSKRFWRTIIILLRNIKNE